MLVQFYPSRRCVDGTLEGHLDGGIPATLPGPSLLASDASAPLAQSMFVSITDRSDGWHAFVSRRTPALLQELFADRYPAIANGVVDVYAVAREPGVRSKVAVDSEELGPQELVGDGIALQQIVLDSGDPVIDVVPTDPDPARYLCNALSPTTLRRIGVGAPSRDFVLVIDDEEDVDVIHFQLASDLIGWRLTVLRQSAFELNEWDATPSAIFTPKAKR